MSSKLRWAEQGVCQSFCNMKDLNSMGLWKVSLLERKDFLQTFWCQFWCNKSSQNMTRYFKFVFICFLTSISIFFHLSSLVAEATGEEEKTEFVDLEDFCGRETQISISPVTLSISSWGPQGVPRPKKITYIIPPARDYGGMESF